MNKIDIDVFLDDFEVEAHSHIEKLELAFIDTGTFGDDPKQIDGVFRAVHSLKGTAGFFKLDKIVSVSHELESIIERIKSGDLKINDEISDIVLESVDCLRDLLNNIHNDDSISITALFDKLNKLSNTGKTEQVDFVQVPFEWDDDIRPIIENALRFGHSIFMIKIKYNKNLKKYYNNPKKMFDNILSVSTIVGVKINDDPDLIFKDTDGALLSEKITDELSNYSNVNLTILATSVLDLTLFSIAIEIDKKDIYLISKKTIFGEKKEEEKPVAFDIKPVVPDIKPVSQTPEKEHNVTIRLDITNINNLLDLANEMILTRNRFISILSEYEKSIPDLSPAMIDISRLTSEIQEKIMLARMQPISLVFGKFPRMVRDMSKTLNKDIGVEILGNDVMLDKYLLDSLVDPLTQIIKNSADHGIESSDKRLELGKPGKGKITLNAYMLDGLAVIDVTDDGSGMNLEKFKKKGLELGLVSKEELAELSDDDIYSFILEPGFSTAENLTNLSGRGVGMDIVKTNIEKLSGIIEIKSQKDKGTTIRLKMPLTLSVIRTLIVSIDGAEYALGEVFVERIVRIQNTSRTRRIEKVNNTLVLSLDGQVIPVITMDEIHTKANSLKPPKAEQLLKKYIKDSVIKSLVLKINDKNYALLIDDALETIQTLAKPLPVYFADCPYYSGVTVLGNGKAIMILDAAGIMQFMNIEAVTGNTFGDLPLDNIENEKQVIVFKCSGNGYYAAETNDITRIDVIHPDLIQKIGKDFYVNINDKTIQVIRPEDFSPVRKRKYEQGKLYILTIKNDLSLIGLLASEVLDKVEAVFEIDDGQICSDFVKGISVYNEKVLMFLNLDEIVDEVYKAKQKNRITKRGIESLKMNFKP